MKWSEILPDYAIKIGDSLALKTQNERARGFNIYPAQDQIFRALSLTHPDQTKVIIIGQDPYHTPGQANGLAFSITNGHPIQPSLANIFAELQNDLHVPAPTTTDLTPWAEQGVLLLNSVLTVQERCANSHKDWGWQEFTSAILKTAMALKQPIAVLAWGRYAQDIAEKAGAYNSPDRILIKSSHPSPFSAAKATYNCPSFINSHPFSRTNTFLKNHNVEPINWVLP